MNHERNLYNFLTENLLDFDIVLSEYLLETIIDVAMFYFDKADYLEAQELEHYLHESLDGLGHNANRKTIHITSQLIVDYFDEQGLLRDERTIVINIGDDDE